MRTNNSFDINQSGTSKPATPIPISIGIPAAMIQGTTVGNITCVSPTTVRVFFNPPLTIPDNMCAHLIQASFPYTQPNIAGLGNNLSTIPNGNNRVTMQMGSTDILTDYFIPIGLYDFNDVAAAFNNIAFVADWTASPISPLFSFQAISATQKIIINVDPSQLIIGPNILVAGTIPLGGFIVNFENPSLDLGDNDSIGPIIGFNTAGGGSSFTVPAGTTLITSYAAPNVADFATITGYALSLSCLTSSYQNGATGNLLYVFGLGGDNAPNNVLEYQASLPFLIPLRQGSYTSIDVTTTDQNNNPLKWQYYQSPFQFTIMLAKSKADGSM